MGALLDADDPAHLCARNPSPCIPSLRALQSRLWPAMACASMGRHEHAGTVPFPASGRRLGHAGCAGMAVGGDPIPIMGISAAGSVGGEAGDLARARRHSPSTLRSRSSPRSSPTSGELRKNWTRLGRDPCSAASSSLPTTTTTSTPRRVTICGPSEIAMRTTSLKRFLASPRVQTRAVTASA